MSTIDALLARELFFLTDAQRTRYGMWLAENATATMRARYNWVHYERLLADYWTDHVLTPSQLVNFNKWLAKELAEGANPSAEVKVMTISLLIAERRILVDACVEQLSVMAQQVVREETQTATAQATK